MGRARGKKGNNGLNDLLPLWQGQECLQFSTKFNCGGFWAKSAALKKLATPWSRIQTSFRNWMPCFGMGSATSLEKIRFLDIPAGGLGVAHPGTACAGGNDSERGGGHEGESGGGGDVADVGGDGGADADAGAGAAGAGGGEAG